MSNRTLRLSAFVLSACCVLTATASLANAAPAEPAPYNPYTATTGFYAGPDNSALRWLAGNKGHPDENAIRQRIGNVSQARWVGFEGKGEGPYTADYVSAAAKVNKLPVLVAYAIPKRDCGQHSSGGAPNTAEYIAWAERFAGSIGNRPAIVILEPDALMHTACFINGERARALRGAIDALNQRAPKTWVYLDAGDGRWNPPRVIAPRMQQVGTQGLRGYSVNVSNYNTGPTIEAFAEGMRNQRIDLPYVWDTSRNGAGPDAVGNWCNPAGRRLGALPQVGGPARADASLWVKHPGTSDGPCGAYPGVGSGVFDPRIAMDLIA